MDDCSYRRVCLNFENQCYRCNSFTLLKLPQETKKSAFRDRLKKGKNETNSWQNLERDSVDKLNNLPTLKSAKRQTGSGNKWYAQGDIVTDSFLLEAKERNQISASGEKHISIKKEWLEKIIMEATISGKYPGLIFRFKNDDSSYAVMEFDNLCQIIHEIALLKQELSILRGL